MRRHESEERKALSRIGEGAVVCVAFIINPTPTRAFSGMTPYEHLHGQKPSLSHLRIF